MKGTIIMSDKLKTVEENLLQNREAVTTEMRQLELPPKILSHFNNIRKRFSNPIVELRNGVCLGCFMSLSSSQKQQVESGDGYGVCEACSRVLYYEEY